MGGDGKKEQCKGARLDGEAEQSNRKKYNNPTINCVATMDKDEGGDVKEDTQKMGARNGQSRGHRTIDLLHASSITQQ